MSFYSNEIQERIHFGEKVPEVRRTNLFMRLLLGGFTLLLVATFVGLIFWITAPKKIGSAFILFIFSCISYGMARRGVVKMHFWRHGIEEAFGIAAAVLFPSAMVILCDQFLRINNRHEEAFGVIVGGACALLMYKQFGWWYAALASAISFSTVPFILQMSPYWTRVSMAFVYLAGLYPLIQAEMRTSFQFEKSRLAFFQVCLIAGMFLMLNLQLFKSPAAVYRAGAVELVTTPRALYWATYILCWVIPLGLIGYGLRNKKRVFIDMGLLTFVLAITTNKPYLGKVRQTWDPIVFGLFLIGLAWIVDRLLSEKIRAERWGFSKDKAPSPLPEGVELAAAGVAAMGQKMAHSPTEHIEHKEFGGGTSGGAGTERGY